MSEKRPVRTLHVVGGMNLGGVETWLMHVLRHIDRSRFQMDFVVHTDRPCAYDDEIRALGSRIIPCLHPSRPLAYARNFRRILRECGPYDVVHSHVHHYSGYILRLAHQVGIPMRIAHSHSDTSELQAKASIPRRAYLRLMKWWIHRHATCGLGVSRQAAGALFGAHWEENPRYRILYYGIDLTPFETEVDKQAIRSDVGIPEDAFVIGHVGRFIEVKNHKFLIEIAAEVAKQKANTYVLLVGDGPLRETVRHQVAETQLADKVIFAGLRSDVPRLMIGAMDVFVMPSFYEGLPLVTLEAQAAGLPMMLSDTITREVAVVSQLVKWLSLEDAALAWSETLLSTRNIRTDQLQWQAREIMQASAFSVATQIATLTDLYALGSAHD